MQIKSAKFLTTATNAGQILKNTKNEFALVGRSNAGKSSLINALTNNNSLAKTSKLAGKTKNINYFDVNNGQFTLIDLPGYGFHKAGKAENDKWDSLMDSYFNTAKSLKCVFILLDVRVKPSQLDKQMIKYLVMLNIPFYIIATKCDKVSKSEQTKLATGIANELALTKNDIILTSSLNKQGLTSITNIIEKYL